MHLLHHILCRFLYLLLIFHNNYPEGHQGGVEIILHDQRIATNGDLRLESTPGQWDSKPTIGERRMDRKEKKISIDGAYPDLNIHYTIAVKAEKEAIRITVDLEQPIPFQWAGKVGFNLELYPPAYFGKSWRMDGQSGFFQRQANGPVKLSSNDNCTPLPLALGMEFTTSARVGSAASASAGPRAMAPSSRALATLTTPRVSE